MKKTLILILFLILILPVWAVPTNGVPLLRPYLQTPLDGNFKSITNAGTIESTNFVGNLANSTNLPAASVVGAVTQAVIATNAHNSTNLFSGTNFGSLQIQSATGSNALVTVDAESGQLTLAVPRGGSGLTIEAGGALGGVGTFLTGLKAADGYGVASTQAIKLSLTDTAHTNATFRGTNWFPAGSGLAFQKYPLTTLANGVNATVPIGTNIFVEISGNTAAVSLHGLWPGTARDGDLRFIIYRQPYALTIAHESGSEPFSTNRIRTMTAADRVTGGPAAMTFLYSASEGRWLLVSLDTLEAYAGNAATATVALTAYRTAEIGTNMMGLAYYGDSILAGVDAATHNSAGVQLVDFYGGYVLYNAQTNTTHDGYVDVFTGLFPGLGSIPITEAALDSTNAHNLKYTTIIMMGHNDGWDGAWPNTVITNLAATNLAALVASLPHTNYLVLPILRDSDWTNGSVEYANTTNFNNYLQTVYGPHFVDYYPAFNVLTNDATDAAQVAAGTIPWRFFNVPEAGYVHMTDAGYNVLASVIAQGLRRLWNETPAPAGTMLPGVINRVAVSNVTATANSWLGRSAGTIGGYPGSDKSIGYNPSEYLGANVNSDLRSNGTAKVWYGAMAPKTIGQYPPSTFSTYSDGSTAILSFGGGNASGTAPVTEFAMYAGNDSSVAGAGTKIISGKSYGLDIIGATTNTGPIKALAFYGPLSWNLLTDVPAGFADGTDDGSGGGADPRFTSSSGTITAASNTFAATTFSGAGGELTLDASGFNQNLATTDNTLQEVAQKLDDLSVSGQTNISAGFSNGLSGVSIASSNVFEVMTTNATKAIRVNTNGTVYLSGVSATTTGIQGPTSGMYLGNSSGNSVIADTTDFRSTAVQDLGRSTIRWGILYATSSSVTGQSASMSSIATNGFVVSSNSYPFISTNALAPGQVAIGSSNGVLTVVQADAAGIKSTNQPTATGSGSEVLPWVFDDAGHYTNAVGQMVTAGTYPNSTFAVGVYDYMAGAGNYWNSALGINFGSTGEFFIHADGTYNLGTGATATANVTTLEFEGATADAFETTFAVTDPTADRTITFPNASGTVALTSDLGGGTTLSNITENGYTVNVASNLNVLGNITNVNNVNFKIQPYGALDLISRSGGNVGVRNSTDTANFWRVSGAGNQYTYGTTDASVADASIWTAGGLYATKGILSSTFGKFGTTVNATNGFIPQIKASFSTNYTTAVSDAVLFCTGTNQLITLLNATNSATVPGKTLTIVVASTTGSVIVTNANGVQTVLGTLSASVPATNRISLITDGLNWW